MLDDRKLTCLGVAKVREDEPNEDETQVQAICAGRGEGFESGPSGRVHTGGGSLCQEGNRHDEVGRKAGGGGDCAANSSDLEGEVFRLVPAQMGIGRAETGDENDNPGNDQADVFHRVFISLLQEASGRLAHVLSVSAALSSRRTVECDEAPGEADHHERTETHEKTSSADPVHEQHAAELLSGLALSNIDLPRRRCW